MEEREFCFSVCVRKSYSFSVMASTLEEAERVAAHLNSAQVVERGTLVSVEADYPRREEDPEPEEESA